MSTQKKFIARQPRHEADVDGLVLAKVRGFHPKLREIFGSVIDISRHGIQLHLDHALAKGDTGFIQLEDGDEILFETAASVQWVKHEYSIWATGFVFAENLSHEALGELFLRNMLKA